MRPTIDLHVLSVSAGFGRTIASRTMLVTAAALLMLGCDGSIASGGGGGGPPGSGGSAFPSLVQVEIGRLVDIYSYRRLIDNEPDRRDTRVRVPTLMQREVLIAADIQSEDLFALDGTVVPTANYRFLPFDQGVGHERLMILWDDRIERAEFERALEAAKAGLDVLRPAYRGQASSLGPIPVVPRNAALKLNFDRALPFSPSFFAANPAVLQLLEMRDDPDAAGPAAFFPARFRVLVDGSALILDTSLIGGETGGAINSAGLNPSVQGSSGANFRIAIPAEGSVSEAFVIEPDPIAELNGLEVRGGIAVIRDFRSGNLADGEDGKLPDGELPMVVADLEMTVISVDQNNGIVQLDKGTINLVPIRGRIPFVDGGTSRSSDLPGGQSAVPTVDELGDPLPLPSGDVLVQQVVSQSGEVFTMSAEIIENLEVGTEVDGFKVLGRAEDGSDGADIQNVRVLVRARPKIDSLGREVWFQAGNTCMVRVHYYEHIDYGSALGVDAGEVSDASRRSLYLTIDPPPPVVDASGQPLPNDGRIRRVDPLATVSLKFSEPMDVVSVGSLDNFLLTQVDAHAGNIVDVMDTPKSASLNVLLTRLVDRNRNGTELRLATPLGHYHLSGSSETYWHHMLLGESRIVDLAGNGIETFDRRQEGTIIVEGESVAVPLQSFSVPYQLEPSAEENLVASRIQRFEAVDEDGTPPGAADYFGQFELLGGALVSAPVTRVSKNADKDTLSQITRFATGQCVDHLFSSPATIVQPFLPTFGNLYLTPSVVPVQRGTVPSSFPDASNVFGGVLEPQTDRGSRLQVAYREDDFGLSAGDPADLNLDVEQMHWAPWNDSTVFFDRFDRYSISLAHSLKRPDVEHVGEGIVLIFPDGTLAKVCLVNPTTNNSGLSLTFADNVLDTGGSVTVVEDRAYTIDPNDAFRAPNGVKYVPYPEFSTTYTWRDSRHVSWDPILDVPTGLGGSQDAVSLFSAGGDHTASVSSPWEADDLREVMTSIDITAPPLVSTPSLGFTQPLALPFTTRGVGDFIGDRNSDLDPVALPLLMDISVFPDVGGQGATGLNLMHIAHVGPPGIFALGLSLPEGYYNQGFITTAAVGWASPNFRVHSTGGFDPVSGAQQTVSPDRELIAVGGGIKDKGVGDPTTGLFQAPPGDSNLPWAQIDLVRRVSLVTFGFFDTMRPNQHDLVGQDPALPGLPPLAGRPDMLSVGEAGLADFLVVMDPPQVSQPGGTRVVVEMRGAETIPTAEIYNPVYGPEAEDRVLLRGNLLNPNYACEAYRYAGPDLGLQFFGAWNYAVDTIFSRPSATGLTPYVSDSDLDSIRNAQGLLPRYMNLRLILENNIASPGVERPSVRSLGVAYRIRRSR